MPVNKLRVALVGAGMIANAGHIPAWQSLSQDAEIVGVYNHTLRRALDTVERHAIPHAYDDLPRMLRDLAPDLVCVTTPNALHREPTIQALQAGAHVLCEKPLATTYLDALDMYRAADEAQRMLFVAQTSRFNNQAFAAKAMVDAGQLGETYYADTAAMRRRGVPTWGRFHMKEASGGGPLFDLGVHILDRVLWLMGNPRVFSASGTTYARLAGREEELVRSLAESGAPVGVHDPHPFDPREFDVEDMAAGFLRLDGGGSISLRTSWAANVAEGSGGTLILGTEGGLRLNPLTLIRNLGGYQVDVTPKVPPDPSTPFYGHWRLAEHVLGVIRGREEPIVQRDEVLNVIRALEGIYQSAEKGKEIRFTD